MEPSQYFDRDGEKGRAFLGLNGRQTIDPRPSKPAFMSRNEGVNGSLRRGILFCSVLFIILYGLDMIPGRGHKLELSTCADCGQNMRPKKVWDFDDVRSLLSFILELFPS